MALISEETVAIVEGVAAEAQRIETPCGDGAMVWRVWGSGPPLVLLHGGYGSWTHWIRNVLASGAASSPSSLPTCPGSASRRPRPSRTPPKAWPRSSSKGSISCCRKTQRRTSPGFSFGGVLGGHVAAQLGDRLRALTLVGSNGLGLVRQPTALQRVPAGASEEEALAVHRHNLGALMIADPAKIDELAVYIQSQNAPRGRVRSRRFSRADTLARALPLVKARLDGIWGERDATAYPHLDERARVLRSFQPEARFEVDRRRRPLGAIRGGRPLQLGPGGNRRVHSSR